jgi:hypothetical protein
MFRNIRDAWRDYRMIHTIASRVAGLALLAFCCMCFWMIFQEAEPTTVALALLTFMGACGIFLTAGQRGLEAWTHRNDGATGYQQNQSYQPNSFPPSGASATDADAGDPPVNPASQDAADDAAADKSEGSGRTE